MLGRAHDEPGSSSFENTSVLCNELIISQVDVSHEVELGKDDGQATLRFLWCSFRVKCIPSKFSFSVVRVELANSKAESQPLDLT